MTVVDAERETPQILDPPLPVRHRLEWTLPWAVALASIAAALAISLFFAVNGHEVDVDVYLMGGHFVLGPGLYSAVLGTSGLVFTYPPFAALTFAPLEHALTLIPAQVVWTLINVAAITSLISVSIKAVRPKIPPRLRWRIAVGLSLPALMLNPVVMTVSLGQVNLILVLLVLWDLAGDRKIGSRTVPLGIATGIAAAIKLTPAIFIPYLFVTGRRRAALTATGTFLACEAVAFLVSPHSSWVYWSKYVFDSNRAGGLIYISNQNLSSVLQRFHHGPVPDSLVLLLSVIVGVVGLALAVYAHRHSSPMLGLLVCATTCLLVSPITWAHHMVWVIPAVVWMIMAPDRPRRGVWIGIGTALLFWAAPIWWVPNKDLREMHLVGWQLVAGNSFFFAMLIFVGGVAYLVARRKALSEARPLLAPAGMSPPG